ncbi:MAG: RNA polymerase sigma factor [Myxococcaceae bacterium]|jgi:RNA polymerase sigma-70 factor (ECF subfamily)|nr:RNA polymerase sigma factor [Myxococcaceae bacterium]
MTALVLTLPRMATDSIAAADPLRALALAARDGEGVAFTQLYERTRELAFRVLYRVVGQSPDLEDLVQESYLQLMRALKGYRGDSKVTTFLHRVCVNVGLMHLRSKRRKPEAVAESDELPEESAPETFDPERAAQVTQAAQLVQKALSTMSDEKAAVFVYHDLLGMKPEEISELVDCPVNTVRSRLNRARVDFTEAVKQLKGSAP